MRIDFCGAARAVTGSCHMVTWEKGRLLVDCGLRQGADAKGVYGEDTFPFNPAEIDAVLLTHAHIDHSGLLPLLVKRGFTGTILCTDATAQLCTILLPDSAHIQMQEAEWQSRKNLRAGKDPVQPLYNLDDAQAALKLLRGVRYGETIQLCGDVQVRMQDVGHLLGSAAMEVWVQEQDARTKIVFSGDLGRANKPIIKDPSFVEDADYLVLEGTYGNRNHDSKTEDEKEKELINAIRSALVRGGNLVIPSFAVGRTQELLFYIKHMLNNNILPELGDVPVYIDSPLGIEATKIYERCAQGYYDAEALEMAKKGSPFDFPTLRIAQSADESKQINEHKGKKIIISSSGMCDAGRIRHHLKHNLYRAESTVLFVGFQAQGTLGRALIDGLKKVKLFGEEVRVNANIDQVKGFSGHAGKDELIEWVQHITPKPKKVFLVHGEEVALMALAHSLTELGYDTEIPQIGDSYEMLHEASQADAVSEEEIVDVNEKAYGYAIREQLARVGALLDSSENRRSPDMALKLILLEADVKSMADKWAAML